MQVWNLFKQNMLFGVISVAGTGIIMAFVMVIWMSWEVQTADISPENNRSQTVYLGNIRSYRNLDKAEINTGLNDRVQKEIFDNLQHATLVTAVEGNIGVVPYMAEDGVRYKLFQMLADTNIFRLFDYRFVAGRPFTSGEMESGARVLVINEKSARKIYGNAENALGKELKPEYQEAFTIVGVVEDVSTFFSTAFSQVWRPASMERNMTAKEGEVKGDGPSGRRSVLYLLMRKGEYALLKDEVDMRVERYNKSQQEYTIFSHQMYETGAGEYGKYIILAVCVLLMLVPAINSIGLNTSLMEQRKDEMGLRKAYGATRFDIIRQLFRENLFYTGLGGIIGLILAWIFVFTSGNWLFSTALDGIVGNMFSLPVSSFFNWSVFAGALFFCFCFNMMSILVPARKISGTRIINAIKREE